MKKLLIIILFFLCYPVFSQTGFGEFKINKTKIDFVVSKYPYFKEVTDSNDYPLSRRFECDRYKMLNIELTGISVYFYNDVLVCFKCDRNPLIEIYLASKYGRPQVIQKSKKINTDFVNYEEEENYYIWNDENVRTVSTYTKQFNEYFKVINNSYFYIYLKGSEKITKYNGS